MLSQAEGTFADTPKADLGESKANLGQQTELAFIFHQREKSPDPIKTTLCAFFAFQP